MISGKVSDSRLIRTRRRGFTILEALIDDGSGTLRVVWFNRPYLAKGLSTGRRVVLFGTVEPDHGGLTLKSPEYEFLDPAEENDPVHAGRVVGIYRRVADLSGKWQRTVIARALDALPSTFPAILPAGDLRQALRDLHFPGTEEFRERAETARRLLAREEFLSFCISLERRRKERRRSLATAWHWSKETSHRLLSLLPFTLTDAQKRAIGEITEDFRAGRPMARLLQGDVGSGKTAVAFLAALLAVENGQQAALMAPTEILAEQHAECFARWLAGSQYRLAILTGQTRSASRKQLLADLRAGEIDILVGTHALIEKPVEFANLGLAIVDEQHRFGVQHRARLSRKGERPHVLVMTATPIPRSLAWTLFGDLEVSRLDEKPPGRGPLRTFLRGPEKRKEIYQFLNSRLAAGERGYVVVPAITESKEELVAAERAMDEIQREVPAANPVLVHGRIPAEQRRQRMADFAAGTANVAVATTVIEVGVDVPAATFIVVENAERFGLAQLHQLRGRVGRGKRRSYCILLVSDGAPPESLERLAILERTADGFEIAERDLQLRGPGDLLGARQSGVPQFLMGDPVQDLDILKEAREEAQRAGRDELMPSDLFPT